MFEHDIALSFAGEQRPQVEQIANCLIAAGVNVFYDKLAKAELWGKDLYQHLSDVYQNKARFCIIFISKEYAEKAWTNHELKAAQARAFTEKGAEYILPVRFDDTEVAGILPTTGFLDYRTDGPAAICSAALAKLGKTNGSVRIAPDTPVSPEIKSCDSSPRAMVISVELNKTVFPVITESTWGDEISFLIESEDREADAILTRFRAHEKQLVVAYGLDVAQAELQTISRNTIHGKSIWTLKLVSRRVDFKDNLEVGTSGTSSDQFAEMRVRRLLLNEFPVKLRDGREDMLGLANDSMKENLIQGLNPVFKVEESIFPDIFRLRGSSPQRFLEIAWISAVADLKLSAAVEHIDYLKLSLSGKSLGVQFKGYRHRKYSNVEPYKIEVSGQLSLAE